MLELHHYVPAAGLADWLNAELAAPHPLLRGWRCVRWDVRQRPGPSLVLVTLSYARAEQQPGEAA